MASIFSLRRRSSLIRLVSLLCIAGFTLLFLRGLPSSDVRSDLDTSAPKARQQFAADRSGSSDRLAPAKWQPPRGSPPDWGADGRGVYLKGEEKKQADMEFKRAGFNAYISDRIPLNRSVGNRRSP
ncbi:hypothetical protein IscW_ISCW019050, partial [Ixodes scapularis]